MVLNRKPMPNFCIAGQALIVSDTSMAISMASVNSAAPLATQPKTRSAIGPERAFFIGGGFVITLWGVSVDGSRATALADSVLDTGPLLLLTRVYTA